MKPLLSIIVIIVPFLLSGQQIDSLLFQKTWMDQESRVINGYTVTKDFGQINRNPAAYNFFPITALAYKDFDQLRSELEKEAKVKNWTAEKLNEELNRLQDTSQGGELQIYISRYDENEANFRWYFVIIRGPDDKGKLFEKEIGYQAPQNPYERGWWNYATMQIPIKLEAPFYVYFNNKNSSYLSDFRFHIDKVSSDE